MNVGLSSIFEYSAGIVYFQSSNNSIYVEILDVDENLCHLKLSIKNINYKYQKKSKKRKIIETKQGFKTLEYKLPKWIKNSLEDINSNTTN